jgi:hypothetical protein
MKPYINSKVQVWTIVALCLITRIPQLISPNLILDGDECVLGIMAKHIMQGKGFPIFFYGQNYGFSLVEALLIIPFYKILGITTLTVKLPMLLLWTTGVIFFYFTLTHIGSKHKYLPFLLTLILVLTPAWAVWSMKARGGYLTAFTVSSILLYLLFHKEYKKRWRTYLICGALTIVIYQSQMLWIVSLGSLILYKLVRHFNWKRIIGFVSGAAISIVLFQLAKLGLEEGYRPDISFPKHDVSTYFTRIPGYIFDSMHGNYFFYNIQKPNFFCAVYSYTFTAICLALPMSGIYYLVKKQCNQLPFIILSISSLALLGLTIFHLFEQPRYLLPLTGSTLLSIFFLLKERSTLENKTLRSLYSILMISSFVSLISFYSFSFCRYTETTLKETIKHLQNKGYYYAFFDDGLVGWQFIFYSNETMICRDRFGSGRSRGYFTKFNAAYESGKKIAVITDKDHFPEVELNNPEHINGLLISYDPPKDALSNVY